MYIDKNELSLCGHGNVLVLLVPGHICFLTEVNQFLTTLSKLKTVEINHSGELKTLNMYILGGIKQMHKLDKAWSLHLM